MSFLADVVALATRLGVASLAPTELEVVVTELETLTAQLRLRIHRDRLSLLPPELLVRVLSQLSLPDLARASCLNTIMAGIKQPRGQSPVLQTLHLLINGTSTFKNVHRLPCGEPSWTQHLFWTLRRAVIEHRRVSHGVLLGSCGVTLPLHPGQRGYLRLPPTCGGDCFHDEEEPNANPDASSDFGCRARIVAAGGAHSILISYTGAVFTTGACDSGQLGHGNLDQDEGVSRVKMLGGCRAVQASAGTAHSVVVMENGDAFSWGCAGNLDCADTLGHGSDHGCPLDMLAPRRVAQSAEQDDEGHFIETSMPRIRLAAAGEAHTLFLSTDGKVYGCGDGTRGCLGRGGSEDPNNEVHLTCSHVPTRIPWQRFVVDLAAGTEFSLAVVDDGRVYAWGSNDRHQLGLNDDSRRDRFVPTLVPVFDVLNVRIQQVAAGCTHALALGSAGEVFSWGTSHTGALGHGRDIVECTEPQQLRRLDADDGVVEWPIADNPVVDIFAGKDHSVALHLRHVCSSVCEGYREYAWLALWGESQFGEYRRGWRGTPTVVFFSGDTMQD